MRPDRRHLAIALAGVTAFLNLYAPQAILPLLAQEFSAGAAEVGMTLTATTFAIALVAPFMGALADVLGRKRVIAAAMAALIVPTVGVALAPSLEIMIAWRLVQGILLPPVFAVTITYIGEEWPAGESTGVTGLYFSAASFGGFLGRFLTGVLADWIGWRNAFLVDAGLTLACALGVAALLTREQRFVRASNLSAAIRHMLRHLRDPQLLATYVVGFGVLFNFIAVFTYVNFLLAAPPFNLTPAYLGSIFVVYLVASLLTPLTGRAVGRFGRRCFVLAVLGLWSCGLALTLVPSLPAIIAGLAVIAGTGFLCQSSATSYVACRPPNSSFIVRPNRSGTLARQLWRSHLSQVNFRPVVILLIDFLAQFAFNCRAQIFRGLKQRDYRAEANKRAWQQAVKGCRSHANVLAQVRSRA